MIGQHLVTAVCLRQLTRASGWAGVLAVLLMIPADIAANPANMIHIAPRYLSVGVLLSPDTAGSQLCSAAVIDSAPGDIVVTAAHCLAGLSGRTVFAPGYRAGRAPIGAWLVRSSYTSRAWQQASDPDADYAFLVVEPVHSSGARGTVQSAAGGDQLGLAPAGGDPVTVIGYPYDRAGEAIECATTVRTTAEFPTVDCPGFSDGTSGGPLFSRLDRTTGTGTIVGVIGGLDKGGCTTGVSYASPFTETTRTVLHGAETGARASAAPRAQRASTC